MMKLDPKRGMVCDVCDCLISESPGSLRTGCACGAVQCPNCGAWDPTSCALTEGGPHRP